MGKKSRKQRPQRKVANTNRNVEESGVDEKVDYVGFDTPSTIPASSGGYVMPSPSQYRLPSQPAFVLPHISPYYGAPRGPETPMPWNLGSLGFQDMPEDELNRELMLDPFSFDPRDTLRTPLFDVEDHNLATTCNERIGQETPYTTLGTDTSGPIEKREAFDSPSWTLQPMTSPLQQRYDWSITPLHQSAVDHPVSWTTPSPTCLKHPTPDTAELHNLDVLHAPTPLVQPQTIHLPSAIPATQPPGIPDLSTLKLNSKGSIENGMLASSPAEKHTGFGFDNVCDACQKLYIDKISCATYSDSQSADLSVSLGCLSHIKADSSCNFCRTLYDMRWSTSESGSYFLHAFSAARMVHSRPIRLLRSMMSKDSESLKDGSLLAVVADSDNAIAVSQISSLKENASFLLATERRTGQGQIEPRTIPKKELDEAEWRHFLWVTKQSTKGRLHEPIPIKSAINQATQLGFVYVYDRYKSFEIKAISIDELRKWQSEGMAVVDCFLVQPKDTGDTDVTENIGYIPHEMRPNSIPLVRDMRSTGFFGQSVDPPVLQYDVLRGWLRQCRKRCNLQGFVKERKRFPRIPFYLFDCQTRETFKVPSSRIHRYVALSYVWGDADLTPRPTMNQLPSAQPGRYANVLEDAMTVTLQLGYRYLWVDCLCVSGSSAVRHEQIANMDVVYKNAELTIVAAAGTNADYGLPGVDRRKLIPQKKVAIGDHEYVSMTVDPLVCIKRSKYETRGWTYQELFFSRRRLIFTDSEVHYECRSQCAASHQQTGLICPPRHLFEGMRQDQYFEEQLGDSYLGRLPSAWKDKFYAADGTYTRIAIFEIKKIFVLVAYEHHVSEYTSRQLSFETDSLQAGLSILDRFTFESHSIYHIQGLPMMPRQADNYVEGNESHSFDFKYGLLWTHGSQETPTKRRMAFPSWTWIGWEGRVNWLVDTTNVAVYTTSPASFASFEFPVAAEKGKKKGSKLCHVDNWRPTQQNHVQPQKLLFTATLYDIPLRVGWERWQAGEVADDSEEAPAEEGKEVAVGSKAPLMTSDAIYLDYGGARVRLHATQTDLIENAKIKPTKFHGIWLGWTSSYNYVLVIREATAAESTKSTHSNKYFERVGVMMIPRTWPGWYGPSVVQGWLV